MRITTPNTVIDAKDINGDIVIATTGVKVSRSRIRGSIGTDVNMPMSSVSATLTDSTVFGSDLDHKAVTIDNGTVLRNNISGGNSGGWCSHCLLQDNYIHQDVVLSPTDPHHLSGYRMRQYTTLRHNTVWCASQPNSDAVGGGCSADLTGYGDFEPVTNNTIDNNFFRANNNGDAFCAYGGSSAGKPYSDGAHDITFTRNVFERGPNGKCAYYATVGDFDPNKPGNVFDATNVYDNGSVVNSFG